MCPHASLDGGFFDAGTKDGAHSSTLSPFPDWWLQGLVEGLFLTETRREFCESAKTVCHICGESAFVKQEVSYLNITFKCVLLTSICLGAEVVASRGAATSGGWHHHLGSRQECTERASWKQEMCSAVLCVQMVVSRLCSGGFHQSDKLTDPWAFQDYALLSRVANH